MASPEILRAALEECIRMGPEIRRPAEDRLAERARGVSGDELAAALAAAERAVSAAEELAREYQDGRRAPGEVVAELQRRFPWLGEEAPAGRGDLAARLGSFGYYLVIM